MSTVRDTTYSRAWPLAIALFAAFGSFVAAWVIFKPPYMGDPGPGFVMPEPTLLQYALAAACVVSPLTAIVVLLLWPSHPWRTIVVMLATIFGLVDLVVGVVAVILAVLVFQSILRGRWPNFF